MQGVTRIFWRVNADALKRDPGTTIHLPGGSHRSFLRGLTWQYDQRFIQHHCGRQYGRGLIGHAKTPMGKTGRKSIGRPWFTSEAGGEDSAVVVIDGTLVVVTLRTV